MQISKGIQIYFNYDTTTGEIREKIELSNGMCPASPMSPQPYLTNSFVPKMPWRALAAQEIGDLVADTGDLPYQENIGIVRLPEELKEIFDETHILDCQTPEDIQAMLENPSEALQQLLAGLSVFLQGFMYSKDTAIRPLGLFINDPGLPTATRNEDNLYMGLHFDNSKHIDIDSLHFSSNRIAINFGAEPRSFLFLNKSLGEVLGMIGLHEAVDRGQFTSKREIVTLFQQYYPDYPVVKIQIDPFEAYIAPVSNIIHDASTLDREDKDISMHILGSFRIGE